MDIKSKLKALVFFLFIYCTGSAYAQDMAMSRAQAQAARETFVEEAKKYVGSPYVYGAIGPDSFDCSGLIYYVAHKSIKVQLPRTAKAIYSYCRIVPDREKEVGDLLFFKTTSSGQISHVGIYIGNNQFISAISDGPNSGVIISSLQQEYWKPRYVACGQFIKSGREKTVSQSNDETSFVNEQSSLAEYKKSAKFTDCVVFDAATFFDWALVTPKEFMFKFRGVDIQTNARYTGIPLQPGFGFAFRINTSQKVFQIPVLFSATFNDYLKIYAGPVISFGDAVLVSTEKSIKPSVFPGILGLSITTPYLELAKFKFQVVQDISYTVFNNMDGAALNFLESISAGLVLYTGIKMSVPLNIFF